MAEDFPGWSNDLAFTEGWGIFEIQYDDDQPTYELQHLQDAGGAGDWGGRWDDDEYAWRHVQAHASYGHAYHIAALEWLRLNSPTEYQRIITGG